MLVLKERRDVSWDDMPNIEDPFFAQSDIKTHFGQSFGAGQIWGLWDALEACVYDGTRRDESALRQLLDALEWGSFF